MAIAKEPRSGHVTTRLTPPFTPAQAAALAEAALADTLETVLRCPARRRVLILDGAPGRWLPPGIEVIPQAPGGLDERLAAAYLAVTDGPALLVIGGPLSRCEQDGQLPQGVRDCVGGHNNALLFATYRGTGERHGRATGTHPAGGSRSAGRTGLRRGPVA